MTMEVMLSDNSPLIEFIQTLENTGERRIVSSTYAHPFFNALNGFEKCWYILPEQSNISINGQTMVDTLPRMFSPSTKEWSLKGKEIPPGCKWLAAGNFFGQNNKVYIYSDTKFLQTKFWHNKTDCFAVEPFIKIDVKPACKQVWKWYLLVLKNDKNH